MTFQWREVLEPFTPKFKNSPNLPKEKCFSEVVRIGVINIFHLGKLWKTKFFILCDVTFLVKLQEKFEIDHSWEWMFGRLHRSSSCHVVSSFLQSRATSWPDMVRGEGIRLIHVSNKTAYTWPENLHVNSSEIHPECVQAFGDARPFPLFLSPIRQQMRAENTALWGTTTPHQYTGPDKYLYMWTVPSGLSTFFGGGALIRSGKATYWIFQRPRDAWITLRTRAGQWDSHDQAVEQKVT